MINSTRTIGLCSPLASETMFRQCFTISASFVKLSILILGVFTFIFNLSFLITVSKSRINISSYKFVDFIEKKLYSGQRNEQFGLNQHLWMNVCCSSPDFLCNVPVFPKAPNTRKIIRQTKFSWSGNELYGQRIFGFLRPPKTARYTFAISSDDSSELWLSSDETSGNSVLIAKVGEKKKDASWTMRYDFWKYPNQISKDIELQENKHYFIDIIHAQTGNDQHLIVQWKESQSGVGKFTDIPPDALTPYLTTEEFSHNPGIFYYDYLIPEAKSCKNMTLENPFLLERHRTYAEHEEFQQVLPLLNLKNKTGHSERRLTAPYEALKNHFQRTDVYPYKPKVKHHLEWAIVPWDSFAIGEEEAMSVVSTYMDRLNATSNGTYILESVANIENTSLTNSVRYLLELDLKNTVTNHTVHLSEYLYQDKHSPRHLYYVNDMQWRRNVKITFVITAKNQGIWLQFFIDDMAKLLKQTKDSNVDIVIFDYESDDLDLKKAVSASGIAHRIKIDSKPGLYSRRESFNIAVDLVDDPHSIVFLVDLHLKLGEALLNDIRKHTVEGHLVYCPIIVRQFQCSTFDNFFYNYYGYYETQGFGIVAMYKSDWDRVGGFTMNYENKYKWGGEDYELVDSIYRNGLDYVRVKCPYVYHIFHSREGMWS